MKRYLVVFVIFAILTVGMTYPLVLEFNSHIPGFQFTDEPYGSIWQFWRVGYSWRNNIPLRHTPLIGHPFGVDLFRSGYIPYFYVVLTYFLSIITTPLITYNLPMIFNIFLSGIFTYFLVFYLTKNRFSGIFSGIVFAFCPYQFARLWQHPGLTFNQWIPLGLLSTILLKEKFSKTNVVLFFCSILLLCSFDLHVMLFGFIAFLVLVVYSIFFNWKTKFSKERILLKDDLKYFKRILIIWILAIIILLPQYFPLLRNTLKLSSTTPSGFNPYRRPFEDLFAQSAKPLSYFLPSAQHPIFGKFTQYFVGDFLYGHSFTEHALYLGWTAIILAFIAFRFWRKNRKEGLIKEENKAEKYNFYIGFFILLVIVAWFFSQPPWWKFGSVRIFMPSFFMYKILPMVRAYARFGILVMLAVAVLSGFGLKVLLEKFKSRQAKIFITCLFSALILFEFLNFPPFKVIDLTKYPQVYDWLKSEPQDIVIAEYPLDVNGPNEMYKFYQTQHQKKIINGSYPGTKANDVAHSIEILSKSNTAGILKWMGVKYVLVHADTYENSGLINFKEELKNIRRNHGLKFIKNYGNIDLYLVIANPIKPDMAEKISN